jgi:hypothetical protein
MPIDGAAVAQFVIRLMNDPDLSRRVLADPRGAVRAEGIEFDAADLKAALGIAGATDHELLAVVEGHLKRLDPARAAVLLDLSTRYLFPDGPPVRQRRPRLAAASGLPLGVLPESGLTERQQRALGILESYDLSPVVQHLTAASPLPPDWLADAAYEFRRYLGMCRVFDSTFAMFSDQVDQVWHTCILFTELYADLCQQVFGRFAHHDPWDEPKPEQVPDLWRRFAGAYSSLYGPPTYLWTIRAAEPPQQEYENVPSSARA